MKQILVISGKGGTGKTVITASFASLVNNKVMADCDVDAADLHLLLHPEIKETHNFEGGKLAVIDKERCSECGKCEEVCRFDAIINKIQNSKFKIQKNIREHKYITDPLACEGCGACTLVCPKEAISLKVEDVGHWFISRTKYGPLVHAKLGIAQENSGRLVSLVREKAQDIALKENLDYVIIDGPPGIGCPVIASLSGVDLALIVTEPTLSGMHDLERVANVARHFGVKTFLCINKYDLNIENSQKIKDLYRNSRMEMIGEIPFDKTVVESLVNGVPIVEFKDTEVSERIKEMWGKIEKEFTN